MAQKKPSRSGSEEPEELDRPTLQAVLLADSFAQKFRPITLERPKVLLPLLGVPMIEYALSWLESSGVEEVLVFCCAHAAQVKDYLAASRYGKSGKAGGFVVTVVESHDAVSAGDALRFIYNLGVIRGDFVLITGDTISNMNLAEALQVHKERRKMNPLAIMTMVIKRSRTLAPAYQTRLGNDEVLMALDPETKELLYYEDKVDDSRRMVTIDKALLASNLTLHLHADMEDCYIDICSPEVLSLFTDNFDYQHLRRHFVKGLLVDDIMGYKIYTHEICSCYVARVDNLRSYDTVSKDIVQRWTYPLVPDIWLFGNASSLKLHRQGIYKASDIKLARSAQIGSYSVIGAGTSIGDQSVIKNSVVGKGCTIGRNVSIQGSYLWDNITIEDGCQLNYSLVCDNVHLRTGVVLEPGSVLSFKVDIGPNVVIPSYSKLSMLPQPSNEDSDEELEYADPSSGVIENSSIVSTRKLSGTDQSATSSDVEQSISQVYIWSKCDPGSDEDWRYSIAPFPSEKLMELFDSVFDDLDALEQDSSNRHASGEGRPDSESTGVEDGDVDDYRESKFEKEVEETFLRGLAGVDQDILILEINALRLSYSLSHADCCGALFYAIMRSALTASRSSKNTLLNATFEAIEQWKGLLGHYIKTADEEIEVILKFEEMCLDTAKDFLPLFVSILHRLYEKEVISEDAILSWAAEKDGADDSDKILLKRCEAFIKWLKEADEEDDEDEDAD